MTPFEIQSALEGMAVICDTREQDTPRLRTRLKSMKCPIVREKLDYGDYSAKFPISNDEWMDLSRVVAVERKMSIDELAHCYCQDRKRFKAEFERAKADGAKIYLIVEDASFEQVYAGKYKTQMKSKALLASMFAWLARYDCQILFCQSLTTGMIIREILYREGKERLEAMLDG